MKQLIQRLSLFPYYVVGIILFFLTHGYSENVGLIPFSEIVYFFLEATAISALVLFFFYKKMKSIIKAGMITCLLIFFYLFFGALQDGLKHSTVLFVLSKYSILLPTIIVIIFFVYLFLKRSSKSFGVMTLYVNLILLVLIFWDIVSIAKQGLKNKTIDDVKKEILLKSLRACDSCNKPDIYLIVLDEYWGNVSLKNYFNYDNSNFTSFLKQKGFFVARNPSSNYACTPVSMASMMDMKYMEWLRGHKNVEAIDYALGAKEMRENVVVDYLKSLGYEMKNFSIFDIDGKDALFDVSDLPIKIRLVTSKTFLNRVIKDLLWKVRVNAPEKSLGFAQLFHRAYKNGDKNIFDLLDAEINNKKAVKPRFVYAHFLMPHYPYIYDSLGRERFDYSYFNPDFSRSKDDSSYLQYLIYTNEKVKAIVNNILKNGKANSTIIVMSDHGNRNFGSASKPISANNNFNAVFIPQKDYKLFYDSVSNVNQFRVIFNSLFRQQLPMLKDSIVF